MAIYWLTMLMHVVRQKIGACPGYYELKMGTKSPNAKTDLVHLLSEQGDFAVRDMRVKHWSADAIRHPKPSRG